MANATPAPAVATITPPRAGPTLRARLKPMAFAITAAGIDSRGTCSPIDACHAGAKAAAPQPMKNVNTSKAPGVIWPSEASTASVKDAVSAKICEASISRRRS